MRLTSLVLSLLTALLTLTGCTSLTPDVYEPLLGSDAPVAIVRSVSASFHEVDGRRLKHPDPSKYFHEAHLPPGPHDVSLTRGFFVYLGIITDFIVYVSDTFTVDMKADHVYELHADISTERDIRVYFWIEDTKTQEIIAGTKLY